MGQGRRRSTYGPSSYGLCSYGRWQWDKAADEVRKVPVRDMAVWIDEWHGRADG